MRSFGRVHETAGRLPTRTLMVKGMLQNYNGRDLIDDRTGTPGFPTRTMKRSLGGYRREPFIDQPHRNTARPGEPCGEFAGIPRGCGVPAG